MASPAELVHTVSCATGVPLPTIVDIDRRLVKGKLRTKAGKPMPVIVAGDYGKGRSLAVTTDTLWRWGFVAAARPGDDGRYKAKVSF